MRAPEMQMLELFEVYEADGSLLMVTSAASHIRLEPGDVVYRRVWSTCAEPVEYNRAGRGDA